jgi:ABC-type phosphate transport system substrate-binding protein
MKTTCRIFKYVLALSALAACPAASAQDVVIVANKGVAVSQLTTAELRDIFRGTRSRFSDGTRAVPVLLKGGPVHEVFLRKHLGDTPDEFRMRWRKAVFTGQASMLREFNTEVMLLQYIASTPGAIGYVSHIGGGDAGSVKVLNMAP